MERKLLNLWINASQNMAATSGSEHQYWLGQVTALTEAMAALHNCTFVEANRELMNMYNKESV